MRGERNKKIAGLIRVAELMGLMILACSGQEEKIEFGGWREMDLPAGDYDGICFTKISALSNDNVYASAEGVRDSILCLFPYIAHYNGTSWEMSYSGSDCGSLYSVQFLASEDGWAAGVGSNGSLMHYDGSSWTHVFSVDTLAPEGLSDICFLSGSTGWAISCGEVKILLYAGGNWQIMDSFPELSDGLFEIHFSGENDGWIVGYSGILHWDGTSWTLFDTTLPVLDVFALSPDDVWFLVEDSSPWCRFYHWNGTDYEISPASARVKSIWCISRDEGWAAGEEIWHYKGSSWTKVSPDGMALGLEDIHFLDSSKGWAVGENLILEYNGGE